MPVSVGVDRIARGIEDALAADPGRLRETADALAARYREGFDAMRLPGAVPRRDPGRRA